MRFTKRNCYRECASNSYFTFHGDISAMELNKFFNQGQPYAAAFECSARYTLNAVKTLKHMRQLIFRNSYTRIIYFKYCKIFFCRKLHSYTSVQCIFKGV